MNIKVTFDSGDFERNFRRQVEEIKDRELGSRARRVAGRRCRQHGKSASVQKTRDGYTVGACCETFAAEIRRELTR